MAFVVGDPYQHRITSVHLLDPRVKLLVAILFVVFVNLIPVGSWRLFLVLFLLLLMISLVSKLGLFYAARRSLFAAPFILAAVAIPFTTPGSRILTMPWFGLVVTDRGLDLALSILARFWLAVQMAVLLASVTRVPDLLWALRKLRVPAVLVSIISVMYRYLRVLGSEATRMLRARTSRSCSMPGKGRPSLIWRGRVTGALIGSLFVRAISRGERIHQAMFSRGYDGTLRSLCGFRMGPVDWIVLTVSFLVAGFASFWIVS